MKNCLIALGVALMLAGGCFSLRLYQIANLRCPKCDSGDLEFLRYAGEVTCYTCRSCKAYVVDDSGVMSKTSNAVDWIHRDVMDPVEAGKLLDSMSGQ